MPEKDTVTTMPTPIRRLSAATLVGLIGLGLPTGSASATVLSQDTTGITHSGGGEAGVEDFIGFSTSGGPSGAASATLSLQIDAPGGQVFEFDSSAYPGIDFEFEFRPLVSGSFSGVTATDPTFALLNPTGNLSLTLVSSSAANNQDIQFYFTTIYTISGTGTFSGFRLDTTMLGTSGQTITWGGGDSRVFSAVGQTVTDQGPVIALVPEPLSLIPAAAAMVGTLLAWRRSRGRLGGR